MVFRGHVLERSAIRKLKRFYEFLRYGPTSMLSALTLYRNKVPEG